MLEISGDATQAKVFTDDLDESARLQITRMVNHEAFADLAVRIMPDVHAGKGSVVGFTCELGTRLIPNVIGVDIGCGVRVDSIHAKRGSWTFEGLDKTIRAHVPSGQSVRATPYAGLANPHSDLGRAFAELEAELHATSRATGQDVERVIRSLGTLGGGNHYLEVDEGDDGTRHLSIHTGSRNFGLRIAEHHQREATRRQTASTDPTLAWLEGEPAEAYTRDMKVAQRYAALNRQVILDVIAKELRWEVGDALAVESVHNYIDFDEGYVRKGAISAAAGRLLVIPISMAEGVIIGCGRGASDWNHSAPHGAGRLLSRTQAKNSLDMKEYKARMTGIWSSCVSRATLDESPMAYKGLAHLLRHIEPSVEVQSILKPVFNFKASD